jgi:GT2 family glycosyltransferase
MTSLAICTAWQNHLELADDYFRAVEAGRPDQVVIVDDGSDPPLEFAGHRLDEPTGFCAANNVGLGLVECEYTLMLNNDVGLIRPDWLDEIRSRLEPGVLLAPLRFDGYGIVDGVDYPYGDGWCLAGLTEDLRRIGGWDESYDVAGPAYFSDCALSFRARMNGIRLRELHPGIFHLGGTTGGADREAFEHAMSVNGNLFASQVRESLR